MAKPEEDGLCGRRLSGLGGTFVEKALAMSGLLVEKSLTMGSLLAFIGSTLVKEALGGTLVKKLLATSSLLL